MAKVIDVKRQKIESVTLEISSDEAQVLVDILSCVGGDDTLTRRRFADAVGNALEELGFDYGALTGGPKDYTGGIDFE